MFNAHLERDESLQYNNLIHIIFLSAIKYKSLWIIIVKFVINTCINRHMWNYICKKVFDWSLSHIRENNISSYKVICKLL